MRQTNPTAWNVKNSNTARHTSKNRRTAALEAKREEEVRKATEVRERRRANQATLYKFMNPVYTSGVTPPDRTYRITAIDHTTGEIRTYYTQYPENIKYIGNTDYLVNGKVRTTYYVHVYQHDANPGGIVEIMRREGGVREN